MSEEKEKKQKIEEQIKQDDLDIAELQKNDKAIMEAIASMAKILSGVKEGIEKILKQQKAGRF